LATFGPFPEQAITGTLAVASSVTANSDLLGCGAFSPVNDFFKDKIVLIERGMCSFLTKVLSAQAVGAMAVIVYDNEVRNQLVVMNADGRTGASTTPAFFISRNDGLLLTQNALDHLQVEVRLNTSEVDREAYYNQPTFFTEDFSNFLILMGVILGISLAYLAGFFCYRSRKRIKGKRVVRRIRYHRQHAVGADVDDAALEMTPQESPSAETVSEDVVSPTVVESDLRNSPSADVENPPTAAQGTDSSPNTEQHQEDNEFDIVVVPAESLAAVEHPSVSFHFIYWLFLVLK
jgi:hypothetical protein